MERIVKDLRDVLPKRPLAYHEAMRLAELQAVKLLAAWGMTKPPVTESVISALPRIEVERIAPLPASVSGGAKWVKGLWVIVLNAAEPLVRQRFSLAHEFKHVLDGTAAEFHYPAIGAMSNEARTEQICDYFAACLLMPKVWVRRAFVNGPQDLRTLARTFGVSVSAMNIRLQALGLIPKIPRCKIPQEAAA